MYRVQVQEIQEVWVQEVWVQHVDVMEEVRYAHAGGMGTGTGGRRPCGRSHKVCRRPIMK